MKFLHILILFAFSNLAIAQKILVYPSDETVNNIKRSGMHTVITLDEGDIKKEWDKKMRDYGKIDKKKDVVTVTQANVSSLSATPITIHSKVIEDKSGTKVWWCIDLGSEFILQGHPKYSEAEKLLRDFAKLMYIDDINEQIAEAEKALKISVRNQEDKIRDGEKLTNSMEKNAKEKQNLEEDLRDNAKDKDQLLKDVSQNKLDQNSANQEVDKMKRAVELVKDKIRGIE